MTKFEYPLSLKRHDQAVIEGRPMRVHSVTPSGKDRHGVASVSLETLTGCVVEMPINRQVEVYR